MKILGISAYYHSSAAALVVDGMPVCSAEEERFSRRKNDPSFPLQAVEWCLDHARLRAQDLDAVVYYEKPLLKLDRVIRSSLASFPRSWRSFAHGMRNLLGEKTWVKGTIGFHLGVAQDRILFTQHHQAHAAAAFLTSPSEAAAILTVDGVGEWTTLSRGAGSRKGGATRIDLTHEHRFPHSLGLLYSTFTAFLGFTINEGEYKVMGLAAYGGPRYAAQVRSLLHRLPDAGFRLEMRFFQFDRSTTCAYSDAFVALFGPPRNPMEPIDLQTDQGRRFADIAASVQFVLEEVLTDIAAGLAKSTGLPDLCLGGGVALNGCANARIAREAGFERVFVPSAPGDAGCALGAALFADRIFFRNADRPFPQHASWGIEANPDDLRRLATEDRLPIQEAASEEEFLARIADRLAQGEVVGWIDGPAELGPRALGHRSLLAAPRDREMRDRLNRDIKFREEFRPFAPAVPAEFLARYFDVPAAGVPLCRFMSGVFPVREEWRAQLAAVTHVDGTARVQAVHPDVSPRLHRLLHAYGARSGVPVLLNTSFNLAGEPIVNTVAEAYSTFWRANIDALASGRILVVKDTGA